MENLKTSGICEMNTIEMKEYSGGVIAPFIIGVLSSVGLIAAVTTLVVGLQVSLGGKRKD